MATSLSEYDQLLAGIHMPEISEQDMQAFATEFSDLILIAQLATLKNYPQLMKFGNRVGRIQVILARTQVDCSIILEVLDRMAFDFYADEWEQVARDLRVLGQKMNLNLPDELACASTDTIV